MKNTILFLSLFPALLFCQSPAQQLGAYLGHRIGNAPPAGAEVSYSFSFREFTRVADGRKNFLQLLTIGQPLNSKDIGPLNGVYIGSQKIEPSEGFTRSARVAQASAEPIPTVGGPTFNIPDSLATARQIEGLKSKYANREFMFVSFMWWDFASWWLHRNAYPFLAIIFGVSAFFAWAASTEYAISSLGGTVFGHAFKQVHSFCAFLMYCAGGIFGAVFMTDALIFLILSGVPWWGVIFVSIIVAMIAGKILGKATPNAKVIRPGGGHSGGWDNNNRLPG